MIGNCEFCGRENVPVAKVNDFGSGEVVACFICQGDIADPYGEIELDERTSGETHMVSSIRSHARTEALRRMERERLLEEAKKHAPLDIKDKPFRCQCLTAEARHRCPDWTVCPNWR